MSFVVIIVNKWSSVNNVVVFTNAQTIPLGIIFNVWGAGIVITHLIEFKRYKNSSLSI